MSQPNIYGIDNDDKVSNKTQDASTSEDWRFTTPNRCINP